VLNSLAINKTKRKIETRKGNRKMQNEYVIWGKQSGKDIEEILYTHLETMKDAQNMIEKLISLYAIQDARIQTIDFSQPLDFTKTLNRKG
jgi:hypothetical protein